MAKQGVIIRVFLLVLDSMPQLILYRIVYFDLRSNLVFEYSWEKGDEGRCKSYMKINVRTTPENGVTS